MNKMNSDNNKKSSIIKYKDYSILKKELSDDELKYAAILCERHNSLSPNDKGEYKCGCHNADKSGGENVLCNAGLWLESCRETFDFIEYIKGKFKYDGILVINNRIKEEDLEEFLLAGGWDVYDNEDDIGNRVIDSCKVCDIAHDYGFAVEDPVSESGAVFIKEGENMGVCYEVYAEVRYEGKWHSLSPFDNERGSKDRPEAEQLLRDILDRLLHCFTHQQDALK